MTKEQVLHIRSVLKLGVDAPVIIFGDNTRRYDESQNPFVWDDDKEVVYIILTNEAAGTNSRMPIHVHAVPYDIIQYLEAKYSVESFKTFMNSITTITEGQLNNLINKYKPPVEDFIKLK